jgi:hypothetical protein
MQKTGIWAGRLAGARWKLERSGGERVGKRGWDGERGGMGMGY